MNGKDAITIKELLDVKFLMIEKSTELARQSMEKRLDGMNEFRQTINDQTKNNITKEYFEAKLDIVQKQVDELRLSRANLEGKASSSSVYVSYVIAGIAIIVSIIGMIQGFIK